MRSDAVFVLRVGDVAAGEKGGLFVDARVAGADGETPGARRAGHDGAAAAGEAFGQLGRVAEDGGADALPRGDDGAFERVHGSIVRQLLGLVGRKKGQVAGGWKHEIRSTLLWAAQRTIGFTIIAMSYALKHRGRPVGIGAASVPHRCGIGAACGAASARRRALTG